MHSRKFFFGVINEAWLNEKTNLISGIERKLPSQCDSPGHCAKYITYSILGQTSNKVTDIGNMSMYPGRKFKQNRGICICQGFK